MHFIGRFDDEVAAARAVDVWLLANRRRRVNLDDKDTLLEWQTNYASIYVGVHSHYGSWLARIRGPTSRSRVAGPTRRSEKALDRRSSTCS